jgi:hypothetical protein
MAMFQKSEEGKRGPNAEEIKKATSSVQRFEKPETSLSTIATAIDVSYYVIIPLQTKTLYPYKEFEGDILELNLGHLLP